MLNTFDIAKDDNDTDDDQATLQCDTYTATTAPSRTLSCRTSDEDATDMPSFPALGEEAPKAHFFAQAVDAPVVQQHQVPHVGFVGVGDGSNYSILKSTTSAALCTTASRDGASFPGIFGKYIAVGGDVAAERGEAQLTQTAQSCQSYTDEAPRHFGLHDVQPKPLDGPTRVGITQQEASDAEDSDGSLDAKAEDVAYVLEECRNLRLLQRRAAEYYQLNEQVAAATERARALAIVVCNDFSRTLYSGEDPGVSQVLAEVPSEFNDVAVENCISGATHLQSIPAAGTNGPDECTSTRLLQLAHSHVLPQEPLYNQSSATLLLLEKPSLHVPHGLTDTFDHCSDDVEPAGCTVTPPAEEELFQHEHFTATIDSNSEEEHPACHLLVGEACSAAG